MIMRNSVFRLDTLSLARSRDMAYLNAVPLLALAMPYVEMSETPASGSRRNRYNGPILHRGK